MLTTITIDAESRVHTEALLFKGRQLFKCALSSFSEEANIPPNPSASSCFAAGRLPDRISGTVINLVQSSQIKILYRIADIHTLFLSVDVSQHSRSSSVRFSKIRHKKPIHLGHPIYPF